jgi:hypothetical protein
MHIVEPVPYVCAAADPVPPSRTPVTVGPESTVCVGRPQFPSPATSPRSLSPSSFDSQSKVEDEYISSEMRLHVTFEVVSQFDKDKDFRSLSSEELSLHGFLDEQIRSLQLVVETQDDAPSLSQEPPQFEMHEECLTPEVLLHIAFEMISQLGKAEESRCLSPEELSLYDFLVEQIRSLQLVVEEKDIAPSLIQASTASAQDPLPSQPDVASVGRCSSTVTQISLDPPVRYGGQVVDMSVLPSGGWDAMLSPPWQRCNLSWDVLGEIPCSALLPVPPLIGVPPPLFIAPMEYALTPRLRFVSKSVEWS